ncbi:HXXEE domain-containing protein [Bacillus infantis]|uniref:HXXEE domain-containing protein n=1 Tax=Bacillus infantis TaxID=324767 RepID=UPI003CF88067
MELVVERGREPVPSSLKKMILLFPFLYLLHDIEEILLVEKFVGSHSDIIPFHVTAAEFSLAFTLLWILASIGCFKAAGGRSFLGMKPVVFGSFLIPGILLANGVGHLFQFIFFRSYVPGIVTSLLIIFPYSFFTAKQLIAERLLTVKRFMGYLILGFVLQAPAALAAHFISKITLGLF